MLIFDLKFTDGKSCRYLCPDPEAIEASELRDLESMFCGRLASMTRIIAPPPEKLPWKRVANDRWELHNFKLRRRFDEECQAMRFILSWPGNEFAAYDKESISAAVRDHWSKGC